MKLTSIINSHIFVMNKRYSSLPLQALAPRKWLFLNLIRRILPCRNSPRMGLPEHLSSPKYQTTGDLTPIY